MAYDPTKDYRRGNRAAEGIPAREAIAITAGASDLTKYVRAVWINTAGVVTGIPIDAVDDTTVSFTCAVSTWLEVGFRRITACPANTIGVR